MVEHNITGIIIPPNNKEILAQAIIDLLLNPKKRRFLSQNVKKASLTKFSWNHIAGLTQKVYEKALES